MKPSYKWLAGSGFLAVSCLSSAVLPATEAEPFDPAMEDESMLLMDIPLVYSASKYEQSVSDAPSWATLITSDEITRYGYRTHAEKQQRQRRRARAG